MRALRLGVLVLLVAYPVVAVAALVSSGIALSQDSISYLSTATSLADGRGLTNFAGQPLTLFPPGLPIVLGLAQLAGIKATTAGAILNVVCVGLAVVGTYLAGRIALRSAWAPVTAAGVVSLSAAFVEIHGWLWTEPLFTVIVLAVLVLLLWSIRRGAAPWWIVVLIGVLASAATSVRYVGYVLLPVVAVGVWWAAQEAGRRSRVLRVLLAVGLGLVAPVVIGARNIAAGSGPLGDRYPGVRTLQDSLGDAMRVAGEFVISPDASTLGTYLGVVMVVIVVVAAWAAVLERDRALLLVAVYVVLYTGAIVWSQATTRLDAPDARLLAPAFPALAILAVRGVGLIMRRVTVDAQTWAAGSASAGVRRRGGALVVAAAWCLLAVVLAVAVAASIRATTRLVGDARAGSLGLQARVDGSPLVVAAADLDSLVGVASNDPWTAYLGLGHGPAVPLPPSAAEWPADRLARDRTVLVDDVRSGTVTHALVFSAGGATQPLTELAEDGITATLVLELPEGSIYRLSTADTIAE